MDYNTWNNNTAVGLLLKSRVMPCAFFNTVWFVKFIFEAIQITCNDTESLNLPTESLKYDLKIICQQNTFGWHRCDCLRTKANQQCVNNIKNFSRFRKSTKSDY